MQAVSKQLQLVVRWICFEFFFKYIVLVGPYYEN